MYAEDDDMTLDPRCKTAFEAEANYGAAEILFQCERFEMEARDYALGINSARQLADKYAASYHAALRRFVERNHRPCLLMVLKKTRRMYAKDKKSYFQNYAIPSDLFFRQFGDAFPDPFLNPEHPVAEIINQQGQGEMNLTDSKGLIRHCVVENFDNQHNVFVLVYPKENSTKGRLVIPKAK